MDDRWSESNLTWRNQRVVVTGGAGFLGSFVAEKRQARGAAEVTVPRIENYDPFVSERLLRLATRIRDELAD